MRKRKRRINKMDIFEYALLLVQFSPGIPFETSYRLWSDYLNDAYPETELRFCISKCCAYLDCRKLLIMFKVDPQPPGSGFNLQYSTSTTPSKEIGPNVVGDLVFERAFPDTYKRRVQGPEVRGLKILSISDCAELCERLVRTTHYTRTIFEVEERSSSFLLMKGDPIFLKWVEDLNKITSEMPPAKRDARIASNIDLIRKVREKHTKL